MTQEEKAGLVLDALFYLPHYRKVGLSEQFLTWYAGKKWVGAGELLQPKELIRVAQKRACITGEYITFMRGVNRFYKPPAKIRKTARDYFGEPSPDCLSTKPTGA